MAYTMRREGCHPARWSRPGSSEPGQHTLYPASSCGLFPPGAGADERLHLRPARRVDVRGEGAAGAVFPRARHDDARADGAPSGRPARVHGLRPRYVDPLPAYRQIRRWQPRSTGFPGAKLVYTNGSVPHAENLLKHLGGISPSFLIDIFDIVASDFARRSPAIRPPLRLFVARVFGVAPARRADDRGHGEEPRPGRRAPA